LSIPALSAPPVLDAEPRPLALSAKLLYGVGEMPITVLMFLSGLLLVFFYTSVMGLPPALVGPGLGATLLLDAFLDPFIGHVSDHTRHRWGRRHVFMLPGSLTMGVCFYLLLSPPRSLGPAGLFLWLIGSMVALRFTSAIYRIPYLSLGAELSRGYDDRTSTMAIRAIFALLGALAAGGSFLLFFPNDADRLRYAAYPRVGLAFGLLMTVSGLFSTIGTRDHGTSAPPSTPHSAAPRFGSGLVMCLRNPAFRKIWVASLIFWLAVTLNFSMALHYFTWYAKINGGALLSSMQLCFFVGALLGVALWMLLARRTEKRTLYIAAVAATAVVMLCATLLVGPGRLFGTGHPLPLMFGHLLAGIFASAYWVLPSSMVADVTDSDELATGRRREGSYYGIMNFGEKAAAGLAFVLSGLLLALFRKLSHGAAFGTPGNPPAAIPYVGMLFGAVPGVLILISLISLMSYRLDRQAVHGIQRELAARGQN
jgi:Na+/melibiose symporter-like transporter